MNDIVHVALAADHGYIPGLKATLVSLIQASKNKNGIKFHIFSVGLYDSDIEELNTLCKQFGYAHDIDYRTPDVSLITRYFMPYKGSYVAFLRLYFPEFFLDLDWILWSDADVLWFRDPIELWHLRNESVSLLWGREPPSGRAHAKEYFRRWHSGFDESRYCCSGILLMNLKRLRAAGLSKKSAEFVKRWGTPPLVDQDILNELCYDDAMIIPDYWGGYNPTPQWKDGVVLHCSGVSMFFGDLIYNGKWPMWAFWFRYYRQVVEGDKKAEVCAPIVRLLFLLLGMVYVPKWLLRCITFCMPVETSDTVSFALYYSWLLRKKFW